MNIHRPWLPMLLLSLGLGIAHADGLSVFERYLQGLDTLSADFRQLTMASDGVSIQESSGRFHLSRPGRFRWEYLQPEGQMLIVADGERVYLHDRELNQVSHRAQSAALDGTPAQLLADKDAFQRDFRSRNIERGDGREWIELEPLAEETQVARIQVGFLDGQLETLIMEDRFGQLTRLIFTNAERNPTLDASLFRFERPPGGDFLQMD